MAPARPPKNILVFVDHPLAIAMASKLVGVLQSRTEGRQAGATFNFLIGGSASSQKGSSVQQDIRELLPEDLMYMLYEHIEVKAGTVADVVDELHAPTGFLPGKPVSVQGRLEFPELVAAAGTPSPFASADVQLPTHTFHGQKCIVGSLESGGFNVPVFFPESSKFQVAFCDGYAVEVTAILRWVPGYAPSGGRTANLAMQCAGLWIQ